MTIQSMILGEHLSEIIVKNYIVFVSFIMNPILEM